VLGHAPDVGRQVVGGGVGDVVEKVRADQRPDAASPSVVATPTAGRWCSARVRGAPPTCRGRAGQRRPAGTPGPGRYGTAWPSRDGSGTSRGGTGSAARPAGPTRGRAAAGRRRPAPREPLSDPVGGSRWSCPLAPPSDELPPRIQQPRRWSAAVPVASAGGLDSRYWCTSREDPIPTCEPTWDQGRQRHDGHRGAGLTLAPGGARDLTSTPDTLVVSKPAGLGGSEKPPMTWIIVLLLILGTAAAVGLRIEARTWRDRPAEPSQAQQWRAMGGG
jgi:hypothetical protein